MDAEKTLQVKESDPARGQTNDIGYHKAKFFYSSWEKNNTTDKGRFSKDSSDLKRNTFYMTNTIRVYL